MKVRAIRIEGDVAYIPLSQGLEAVIDAVDVPRVCEFVWHARKAPKTFYAARNAVIDGRSRTVLLHRELTQCASTLHVDHKDGDGLNNRRDNLREATRSQNMWNQGVRKNNSSGFKGVHWHSLVGKWRSEITQNGEKMVLGYFDTAESAAAAYALANANLRGEFARTA